VIVWEQDRQDDPNSKGGDEESATLIVHFLVPVVDRSGRPYKPSVYKNLQRELEQRFGGWSLAAPEPLRGAWRVPESDDVEYDDSWRYEVGIEPTRLAELDELLAVVAGRMGQKAIWRVVFRGDARAVAAGTSEEGS
jgi:hypothetical protein